MAWQRPPSNIEPSQDHVDVWRSRLDVAPELAEKYLAILSKDERERANRYTIESKQRQFIVARGFLRRTLGLMLDANPRAFTFQYGPHGKPTLAGEDQVQFNVSHAGHWMVLAVTQGRQVGIDVEKQQSRPHLKAMAERFFAPEESKTLLALPPEQQVAAFYTCWCRKEAMLKAAGMGIWIGLDKFAVTVEPTSKPKLLRADWPKQIAPEWSMQDLCVDDDHASCLAYEGPVVPTRLWDRATLPIAPSDARGKPRIGAP